MRMSCENEIPNIIMIWKNSLAAIMLTSAHYYRKILSCRFSAAKERKAQHTTENEE